MTCRHCGRRKVIRPRGLCWPCYYTPGVKGLYPPGSMNPGTEKYARRGVGNGFRHERPLPSPTGHLPGTPEKLAVVAARAAAGEALWHPADATHGPSRPSAGPSHVKFHGPYPLRGVRTMGDLAQVGSVGQEGWS